MNAGERNVGMILAGALDLVKHNLGGEEGWRLAIYLGREDDPQNAYLVGNAEPAQIKAAIELLMIDADKLGTINRDGGFVPD